LGKEKQYKFKKWAQRQIIGRLNIYLRMKAIMENINMLFSLRRTCFLMWVNKTESLDQYIALRLIAINVHTHPLTHTHTQTNTHTHTQTQKTTATNLLMVCMHFVSYCVCLLLCECVCFFNGCAPQSNEYRWWLPKCDISHLASKKQLRLSPPEKSIKMSSALITFLPF